MALEVFRPCAWSEVLELLCDELARVELIYNVEETHQLGLVARQNLQMIY